jgi:hypothetical protein
LFWLITRATTPLDSIPALYFKYTVSEFLFQLGLFSAWFLYCAPTEFRKVFYIPFKLSVIPS